MNYLSLKIFIARILVVYPKILRDKFVPYRFDYSKYKDSFISKSAPVLDAKLDKAPEVIYVFWTGNNDLSENRKKGLASLIRNSGIEVKVITPNNLDEYVLEDYPLHPAYEYLSLVHKSDYLRCYFMHHYGGGYSDIKSCNKPWKMAFKKINASRKYVLGYREVSSGSIPRTHTTVDSYMSRYFFKSVGVCAFIFKPKSPLTTEWITELHINLDYFYSRLKMNPGNTYGNNTGYPIEWTQILGQILIPLFFKYYTSIIMDKSVQPNFRNYR